MVLEFTKMRPVLKATSNCGGDTWHVLQPSHSHLCGYEDFSNASVIFN